MQVRHLLAEDWNVPVHSATIPVRQDSFRAPYAGAFGRLAHAASGHALSATADLQHTLHPGYNAGRGPVNFGALRLHYQQ